MVTAEDADQDSDVEGIGPPGSDGCTPGSADAIGPLKALELENQRLRATIDEMRGHAARLQMLADSDTLTPLVNRRRFVCEVERTLAAVRRYGTSAVLLFADVDGLKQINDANGHSIGDAALVHVSRLLLANVRSTDLVARIGGDEFGLLLNHLSEPAAAVKLETLSRAIAETPLRVEGQEIALAVSLGMTPLQAADDVDTVLRRADTAMYEIRRLRRSRAQ